MIKINQSKVALITGGGRRVGAAIARELHAEEMKVILHCNTSENEAKKLCDEFNTQRQDSAAILTADLSVFDNITPLIQQAVGIWGRLDALVNNASIFYKTEIGNISSHT